VVEKPEEKRPLGTLTYRWGITLEWISQDSRVDWIYLVQDMEK